MLSAAAGSSSDVPKKEHGQFCFLFRDDQIGFKFRALVEAFLV